MSVKSRKKQPNTTEKQSASTPLWKYEVFQELADNISDGVYCINADGYFTFVNRAITERSGMPPHKFYKSHFLGIVNPSYRDQAAQNFQRVMSGENGIVYELRYESADGQTRIVQVNSQPIRSDGKVVGLLGIARDITEQKRAEELFHKAEARYHAIVEDQEEMICRFLPDSTLTFVNSAYCCYFGKSRDELLGKKFLSMIPGKERKMVTERIAALSPERPTEMHEQRAIAAGGEIRWQQWVNRQLFDKQGNLTELQAVGRDITTRKLAEEALKASEINLSRLVKERTAELTKRNMQLEVEIRGRKRVEETLRKRGRELNRQARKLEELNTALKVLLKQREEDRKELEGKVVSNVKELLLPYVEQMKEMKLDSRSKVFLSVFESNLKSIISSFPQRLTSKQSGLTPREVQVADLIRQGKSTKDIARFTRISTSAVSLHRYHIREKLGIIDQKINLRTHLQTLS